MSLDPRRAWLGALACAALGLPLGRLAAMRPHLRDLAPLQQSAWLGVEAALARWGGALLAEDVGAGKTHIALAALALRGGGQVYAPAALLGAWREAYRRAKLDGRVALHSHHRLVALGRSQCEAAPSAPPRPTRSQCEAAPSAPPRPTRGLVVVDEAHALTHEAALRRRGALEALAGQQTLLLSATPAGTSWDELGALLGVCALEAPWRAAYGGSLRGWVASGAPSTDPGRLWGSVVVRHPRRLWALASLGAPDGAARLCFPRKERVELAWSCDGDPALEALEEYASAWDERLGEVPRGLLRALLASRLESSPAALLGTVARLEGLGLRALEAARLGRRLEREAWRRWFRAEGAQEDRQQVFPFWYEAGGAALCEGADPSAWEGWVARTRAFAARVAGSGAGQRKLSALLGWVSGWEGRAVVFARSVETARWLWGALRDALPRRPVGLLTGSQAQLGAARAPGGAAGLGGVVRALEGSEGALLVATEVLSEGVDLARWQAAVSFDLPWTPRRLAQRLGRVDRLGPPGREVWAVVLRPSGQLEGRLRAVERLEARASMLGAWGGGAVAQPEGEAVGLWRARRAALLWGRAEEGPRWGGWGAQPCARASAGCLFAVLVGEAPSWVWVPEGGVAEAVGWEEAWGRLETLARRAARWEDDPPARAWAAAWAWARGALEERAREVSAPSGLGGGAQGEALRRLAALGPPPRWEPARVALWARVHAALRHRLEPRAAARLREVLGRGEPPGGWLDAIARAVEAGDGAGSPPEVAWLGFVRWGR